MLNYKKLSCQGTRDYFSSWAKQVAQAAAVRGGGGDAEEPAGGRPRWEAPVGAPRGLTCGSRARGLQLGAWSLRGFCSRRGRESGSGQASREGSVQSCRQGRHKTSGFPGLLPQPCSDGSLGPAGCCHREPQPEKWVRRHPAGLLGAAPSPGT